MNGQIHPGGGLTMNTGKLEAYNVRHRIINPLRLPDFVSGDLEDERCLNSRKVGTLL